MIAKIATCFLINKKMHTIPNNHQMKNIIVPLDFSTDALKGLDFAILIGQQVTVNIQLVNVQRRTDLPGVAEEEYNNAEKRLKKIVESYKPKLANGSHISYIIKKGKVYQEVVGQAQAFNDSIIIASTHGASGFEELFIGSNAFRIVSSTNRPVITIRKGPIPEKVKKILLPIDISVESRQKVLFASVFASLLGAEIHVVSVSGSKSKKVASRLNAYVAQVCNFLKTKEIPFYSTSLIGGNPTADILDYAEKIEADVIAISNEGSDSFTELILGSEAQAIIYKSPIPVLTIRAKSHVIKGSFSTFGG